LSICNSYFVTGYPIHHNNISGATNCLLSNKC